MYVAEAVEVKVKMYVKTQLISDILYSVKTQPSTSEPEHYEYIL
jgi:hypothetical protein